MRGHTSIQEMREAIKRAGRDLPIISQVARMGILDAAAFRERAAKGLPLVITWLIGKWPLSALPPQTLRDRFGGLHGCARVGDCVNTAFAPDLARFANIGL